MTPTSTQNGAHRPKIPSWSLLGALATPGGRPGPSKTASERLLGGLLAALGAFLGPSWRLLGLSWPSRGAPGGSRGASGRSFLVLFLEAGAGTLKFHVF